MIDAHFHRNVYDTFLAVDGREYRFHGVHPWQCAIGTIAPPGNVDEVGAQSSRLRAQDVYPSVGAQSSRLRAQDMSLSAGAQSSRLRAQDESLSVGAQSSRLRAQDESLSVGAQSSRLRVQDVSLSAGAQSSRLRAQDVYPSVGAQSSRLRAQDMSLSVGAQSSRLRVLLESDPHAGVGEIGLDRLKTREVSSVQREMFARQLALAAELHRPTVLHGAKCWGEVVKACRPHAGRIPAFLFHGFSRSGGLLPDICALNGFVSVGLAVLNDHAVNYRELVKEIPLERLLVETDADVGIDGQDSDDMKGTQDLKVSHVSSDPKDLKGADDVESLRQAVLNGLAAVRGMDAAELEGVIAANAWRFVESLA